MLIDYWDGLALSRKLYQEKLEPVCKRFGLTRLELDILLFLANNPHYDTATDLVEKRKIAKSHVSVSVGRLKKRGCLEAVLEEGNRKTNHLKLLDASREIIGAGQAAQKDFLDQVLLGFSEEEIMGMVVIFRKISRNARRALKEG